MRLASAAFGLVLGLAAVAAAPVFAQQAYDPSARIAAQKEAMAKLSFLDGRWRGEAKSLRNDGGWHPMTQTERVGPMLDGTIRVVEGRGYEANGALSFNAVAVISYDTDTKAYTMRSYASGRVGDFPIQVRPDGFSWEITAGPQKIRYEAVVKDGVWTEIGWRTPPNGARPVKFIEFTVKRLDDSAWPAGGFMPPK